MDNNEVRHIKEFGMRTNQNDNEQIFNSLEDFKKAYLPEQYKREQLDKLWQAAQQQSAGEIAALQDELNDADGCATYQAEKIIELKADNERLREALEIAKSVCNSVNRSKYYQCLIAGEIHYSQTEEWVDWVYLEVLPKVEQALSATTSQSLQAHDGVKGK